MSETPREVKRDTVERQAREFADQIHRKGRVSYEEATKQGRRIAEESAERVNQQRRGES